MDNSSIIQKISNALVTASSTFRDDQVDAYRKAIEKETNPKSKWILSQILENAQVAQLCCGPMCDDTGIPHVFIELGKNKGLTGETIFSINEGIKEGLRLLPGRPMAVKGDDMCRLDQSQGLDMDPAALEMAPLIVKHIDEDILRATILMLGGGPAIRGITHRYFINIVLTLLLMRLLPEHKRRCQNLAVLHVLWLLELDVLNMRRQH